MNKPKKLRKSQPQLEKFKKAARDLGVTEDEAAFKRKLARLAKAKKPEKKKTPDD